MFVLRSQEIMSEPDDVQQAAAVQVRSSYADKIKEALQTLHETSERTRRHLEALQSGHATHRYGDGTYTGQWENRLPHGQGELTCDDGSFYKGSWFNGKMDGQGKLVENGFFYEGSWLNGKMDGQGKIDNGRTVYEGSWRDDRMEGQGTWEYVDGQIYKGSFWNNQFDGEGKFVDANGDMYEGTWRHSKREGEGIQVYAVDGKTSLPGCDYTWNAGDVYEGGFKANSRHGACRYTFFNGEMAHFTWVNGVCPEFNARQAAILMARSMVCTYLPCSAALLHLLMRSQVACQQFDPDAHFKSWDSVFIAISNKSIIIGSSRDKVLSGALGHSVAAEKARKIIPLAGCSVRAVLEHHGRKHVMAVATPPTSSASMHDSFFSFDDSAARDAFIERLQVRIPPDVARNVLCLSQGFLFVLYVS